MPIYQIVAVTEYGMKTIGYTADPGHREPNIEGYISIVLFPLCFREDVEQYIRYTETGIVAD